MASEGPAAAVRVRDVDVEAVKTADDDSDVEAQATGYGSGSKASHADGDGNGDVDGDGRSRRGSVEYEAGPGSVTGGSVKSRPASEWGDADADGEAETEDGSSCGCCRRAKKQCSVAHAISFLFVACLFLGGTLSFIIPAVRHEMLTFLDWVESKPIDGAFAYTAFFAIGGVLCFPEIVMCAAAGYLFKIPVAVLVAYVGAMFASVGSFYSSRLLLRNTVRRILVQPSQLMRKVDTLIPQHAFKFVLLLRLPYVPFVQMNWILGASPVPFLPYLAGTALGLIPGSILYSFIGHGIRSIQNYIEGKESLGPVPLVLTAGGFVCAIFAFVFMGCAAKRAIKNATNTEQLTPIVKDSA